MDSDKMLIEMLSDQHKPFMIILTKADKVKDARDWRVTKQNSRVH
jgi:GTP-binding protein EngB required for normal cell division